MDVFQTDAGGHVWPEEKHGEGEEREDCQAHILHILSLRAKCQGLSK